MFAYCSVCGKYDSGDFDTMEEINEQIIKDGGNVEPEICPVCRRQNTLRVD